MTMLLLCLLCFVAALPLGFFAGKRRQRETTRGLYRLLLDAPRTSRVGVVDAVHQTLERTVPAVCAYRTEFVEEGPGAFLVRIVLSPRWKFWRPR
jgi:hypothetical protein